MENLKTDEVENHIDEDSFRQYDYIPQRHGTMIVQPEHEYSRQITYYDIYDEYCPVGYSPLREVPVQDGL